MSRKVLLVGGVVSLTSGFLRGLPLTAIRTRHPHASRHLVTAAAEPAEVTTDRAWTLARAIDELLPGTRHDTTRYANNRVETYHGRLKAGCGPCAGSNAHAPRR